MELMRHSFAWDWAPDVETAFLDSYIGRKGLCLAKNPFDYINLAAMLSDPRVWVIFMLRDPRDIVCSRHGKVPNRYWTNLQQVKRAHRSIANYRNHPRLVLVRYEDLVRNPASIQKQIIRKITWLHPVQNFADYHAFAKPSEQSLVAMHSVRPITDRSVGSWRENLPRLASQIALHGSIDNLLLDNGYETDGSWLSCLDGVLPDTLPGFWPDRPSRARRLRVLLRRFRKVSKFYFVMAATFIFWRDR